MSTAFSKKPFALASLLLVAVFPACGGSNDDDTRNIGDLPEPSGAYCASHGGSLEIRTEAAGQYGVCKFYGGSECDTWAFYRGECKPGDCTKWETCKLGADGGAADASPAVPTSGCEGCMANPASVNCEKKGGKLEIRTETAGQYGVCKFHDSSECDEWAFYRGECKPGDCATWESCKLTVDGGAGASAKRRAPADVVPVTSENVRYEAPHFNNPCASNGGCVVAYDNTSNAVLWSLRVYCTHADPNEESDVQDVFIKSLDIEAGQLRVTNEKNQSFLVSPTTHAVTGDARGFL